MVALLPLSLFDSAAPAPVVAGFDAAHVQGTVERVLAEHDIAAQVLSAVAGPVVYRCEFQLAEGASAAKVTLRLREFERAFDVKSARLYETETDSGHMVFEAENAGRRPIRLVEFFGADAFQGNADDPVVPLGRSITGAPVSTSLSGLGHLLIASGSAPENVVAVNGVLLSLLAQATPDMLQLVMVDSQKHSFDAYAGVPHLVEPVITETRKGIEALYRAVDETLRRLKLLDDAGIADIATYNRVVRTGELAGTPLPRMVVVLDEFADVMRTARREVELLLARITIRGHLAGVHLLIATQWISFDTVTGLLRAGFPSRIAFKARSMTDSRRVVDVNGAEALLGQGDMLYRAEGADARRVHGVFVSRDEVARVCDFLRTQSSAD